LFIIEQTLLVKLVRNIHIVIIENWMGSNMKRTELTAEGQEKNSNAVQELLVWSSNNVEKVDHVKETRVF